MPKLDNRSVWSFVGLIVVIALVGLITRYFSPSSSNIYNLTMNLTSPSFTNNTSIPSQFTCDGQDISPELHWSAAPAETKSFVLIVRDPDAPAKDEWTHWIVKNIPSTVAGAKEGTSPIGGEEIMNDFNQVEWGGPCPPDGEHRYFFQVYALDVETISGTALNEIESAMQGHVLAKAELMGIYERP